MLKIVIAYDGSRQARAALERVSWFAHSKVEAIVVTSVPPYPPGVHPAQNDPYDGEVLEKRHLLEQAVEQLRAKNVDATGKLIIGDPADSVLDTAESEKADLIITGSRGWNLAKRLVLGSVSSTIAHHATCAVMIVR